jgi:hypothetical protein
LKRYLSGLLTGLAVAFAFCLGSLRPAAQAQNLAGWIYTDTANASGACPSPGALWINTSTGLWWWCDGTGGTWQALPYAGGPQVNYVQPSITMTGGPGLYSVPVTGQTWVTSSSKIACTPSGTTADGLTPEQVALESLSATVGSLSPGIGFTLYVSNLNGSFGTFRYNCVGA